MTFISYAQNYEDVILWRALHDVERGFYVDVGAADPEEDSVTLAFYERGWSGINIEPLDEYFAKLMQARPRDTNLRLVVGRESGLQPLHVFRGTGLSTLDPEIARKHRVSGNMGSEILAPVLTLTEILENCKPPTIHFLKIDVEGAEEDALRGLDLEQIRPWIIVVEAKKPNSTDSTRSEWESLVTGRGYDFAYFDGLNCFYSANEVAPLKERLSVPPNLFDDFIRFKEWTLLREVADLKQDASGLRGQVRDLEVALRAGHTQTANLGAALQSAQEQLRAVGAERAKEITLHSRVDDFSGRIRDLSAQLGMPSVDRAVGRALRRARETGDRFTGGGLRSLAKRALATFVQRFSRNRIVMAVGGTILKPFPRVAATLYNLAAERDAVSASSTPPAVGPLTSDDAATAVALPASAQSLYLKLKAAMSNNEPWNQTQ